MAVIVLALKTEHDRAHRHARGWTPHTQRQYVTVGHHGAVGVQGRRNGLWARRAHIGRGAADEQQRAGHAPKKTMSYNPRDSAHHRQRPYMDRMCSTQSVVMTASRLREAAW